MNQNDYYSIFLTSVNKKTLMMGLEFVGTTTKPGILIKNHYIIEKIHTFSEKLIIYLAK